MKRDEYALVEIDEGFLPLMRQDTTPKNEVIPEGDHGKEKESQRSPTSAPSCS